MATTGHFDKLSGNGVGRVSGLPPPFGLTPTPFGLSLSKPSLSLSKGHRHPCVTPRHDRP
jgi:hypothetical protein